MAEAGLTASLCIPLNQVPGQARLWPPQEHWPILCHAGRYARKGVQLSLSTLADHVGTCCVAFAPIVDRIEAHVMAASRLNGDDTTVPVLARGKTDAGRPGSMSAMTGRSAAAIRPPRYSTTRAIAEVPTRSRISPATGLTEHEAKFAIDAAVQQWLEPKDACEADVERLLAWR